MSAFRCGHPRTPENTKPHGRGVRCRTCRRELELRAYHARKPAPADPVSFSEVFRCGHPKPDDARKRKAGCSTCKNAKQKAKRAELRAERLAQKEANRPERSTERQHRLWAGANDILLRTAQATGSSLEFLLSDKRWPEIVHPRQAAMLVMRRTGLSFPKIGLLLGRDHSTVIHGCEAALRRASRNARYRSLIAKIEGVAA
jgi:hypothetical protein